MGLPAARVGDMHVCPKVEPGPVPHVGGPLVLGSQNVIIDGMPAARVGDAAVCIGPPDKVATGSSSVLINDKPAARMGDTCEHGGKITIGCPTVLIGGESVATAPAISSSHLFNPPQSKQEVLQRIEQATQKIQECRQNKQALPGSPYTLADNSRIVEKGLSEKFIVRVIETQYAKDSGTIGYMSEGATTSTYWTTTYTQLEHADKDAELIAKTIGVEYKPEAKYTLLLIDQEQAHAKGDMISFIPTYKNLSNFAKTELTDEFEGSEHLIAPCMTPQYSKSYEQVVQAAHENKYNLNDKKDFNALTESMAFDKEQAQILSVRHQINKKLGANEHFLGNGMTKNNTAKNPVTPFGEPKQGQSYGPLETFTYDKNPQTLGKLEQAGILTRIPLNNLHG